MSDIEAFPRAVLRHHYPDVPLHGRDRRKGEDLDDYAAEAGFQTIKGDEYGSVQLLVGGTPCQSFSIAGLRGGLDDQRGNLSLEYARLADRLRPRWIVWENVPGVLSSDGGRDFGAIIGALAHLGYDLAWRVLDAQYFGVPQRRRRVFLVGYLGDYRRAAAVLFERESMRRSAPPRRRSREGIAPTLSARTRGGGGLGTDFDLDGGLIAADMLAIGEYGDGSTASTVKARDFKDATDLVAHSLPLAYSIQERAVSDNPAAGPQGKGWEEETAFTLEARHHVQAVAGALCKDTYWGGAGGRPEGASVGHFLPVAFSAKDHGADAMEDCSPTLRAGGFTGSHANGGVMPAVAFKIGAGSAAGSIGAAEELSPTLGAGQSGTQLSPGLATDWGVRRLTPRECERLQGFPDDYTRIPWRGADPENCPDGPRYKALGNSMAVPVMRWIGERIDLMEKLEARGVL